MGRRGYPLLLASGETADGATHLIDRQHPHDLVMELAGSYSRRLDDREFGLSISGLSGRAGAGAGGLHAPRLGAWTIRPRPSPITGWIPPISRFGVATAGVVLDDWKLEVSQFTGREPDQHRFGFDHPRMDSTAARISFNPDEHWSLQASWGHLNSPERWSPRSTRRAIPPAAPMSPISGKKARWPRLWPGA